MGRTAITIGNFDGVHLGHAALVRRARELVGEHGRVTVLAFDPHPMTRLAPGAAPERLSTFAQRERWLKELGADAVDRLEPSPELLGLSPEAFVRAKLERHADSQGDGAVFVEGPDFHFGKGRSGDVETLRELGGRLGFACEVVDPVEVALTDHQVARASSTLARWLLKHGRTRDAAAVLGRGYELTGMVVRGDQRGRTIGYPTINVAAEQMLPATGVYAGWATLPDGVRVRAAVNVGDRPTFDGSGVRAEAYLFGADGQAWRPPEGWAEYGWNVRLGLDAWVRDDLRFDGVERLVDQIGRDVVACRNALTGSLRVVNSGVLHV